MKKFRRVVQKLEEKAPKDLAKISLFLFLLSLMVGFSVGLVFREFRLNRLLAQQKNLEVQEDRQINSLFEKFSPKR